MDMTAIMAKPEQSGRFWMISAPITGTIIGGVYWVARRVGRLREMEVAEESDNLETGGVRGSGKAGWLRRWSLYHHNDDHLHSGKVKGA